MSFMETKRISDLNPYSINVCILVVVSRLTAIKTSKNGNPFFNFVATDASGEIEGVCFEPRLHEKLQEGASYRLTRFLVKPNKFNNNQFYILLNRATLIERIQPLQINVATRFITIDEIFKSGQDGQLIDFKGHLLEKPTITHENTPDNKVIDKLTVQVTDEENVMAITMTALNDNIFREKYEENTRFTLLSGIIRVWEGQKSIQIIARSIIKFERPDVPY